MERLAEVTGLPVIQTITVNAITEYSTYCTSIVARDLDGNICHVRNLDFDNTAVMKKLVHEGILIKDGEERGRSMIIAGYYGSYTGRKNNSFSVSYNVRETVDNPTDETILSNLAHTLDAEYTPLWILT